MSIDTTGLYSFNGEYPSELPNRIRLSDGKTKTDIITFAIEDLIDAGYVGPISKPTYDPSYQTLSWNNIDCKFEVQDSPEEQKYTPEKLRSYRQEEFLCRKNSLLFQSDWTQLPDSPLNKSEVLAWREYRVQLREMTNIVGYGTTGGVDDLLSYDSLDNLPWPTPPV